MHDTKEIYWKPQDTNEQTHVTQDASLGSGQ